MTMDCSVVPSTIQELVTGLNHAFETDKVNIEEVDTLMTNYLGNKEDWMPYAIVDKYKYTRNLVDEGNGKYNLILLCWGEGHGSSIHDHADAHCFMKVLGGEVKETLFEWPTEGTTEMKAFKSTIYTKGQVAYINDTIGLHRVENASHTDGAFTLHLYCPPFKFCSAFDQKTGKKFQCPVTFWSKYGVKETSLKTPQSAVIPDNN